MVPVASVLIPVWPPTDTWLADTLASVEAQTVPIEILTERDEDGVGVAAMRNRLLAQATTEWVQFLDHDDLIPPDKIERQIAIAEATGADAVWCGWAMGPSPERILRTETVGGWNLSGRLRQGQCPVPHAWLIRRSACPVLASEPCRHTLDLAAALMDICSLAVDAGEPVFYRTAWSSEQVTADGDALSEAQTAFVAERAR